MFAPGYVDGPVCVHLASCWRSQVNSYDECELEFVNVKGGCQEKERNRDTQSFANLTLPQYVSPLPRLVSSVFAIIAETTRESLALRNS